jgi:hypothetical protein
MIANARVVELVTTSAGYVLAQVRAKEERQGEWE